ncbi:MAG: hypothetical protein A2Z34_00715 [Planctomycetes bacterium RBG_16_59_8]|nr:MAG: hypothetical protein A2Z34_00715 [Planctomycetes bacterium RBG_16_59_8]
MATQNEWTSRQTVKQSDECAWQSIGGRMVIVYPREREIHRLNEVGSAIWQWIEEPRTVAEIALRLADQFDVSKTVAAKDVGQFLAELLDKHLITVKA